MLKENMKTTSIKQIATEIGALVETKDAAYGNAFDLAGDFLKLLYPNGVSPNQYKDMLCLVRIFDKQKRIATNKGAFGENPYRDIVGYGMLGARSYANSDEQKELLSAIDGFSPQEESFDRTPNKTNNLLNKVDKLKE
jgi:hypothetical protein